MFDTTKTYQFKKELFYAERGMSSETVGAYAPWIRDIEGLDFQPINEYYGIVGSSLVLPEWCEEVEAKIPMEFTQSELDFLYEGISAYQGKTQEDKEKAKQLKEKIKKQTDKQK